MTCFCLSLGPTQQLAYGWGQVLFCESQQQALSGCEPPSDVNRSGVKRRPSLCSLAPVVPLGRSAWCGPPLTDLASRQFDVGTRAPNARFCVLCTARGRHPDKERPTAGRPMFPFLSAIPLRGRDRKGTHTWYILLHNPPLAKQDFTEHLSLFLSLSCQGSRAVFGSMRPSQSFSSIDIDFAARSIRPRPDSRTYQFTLDATAHLLFYSRPNAQRYALDLI
jgi:hypothetical protein